MPLVMTPVDMPSLGYHRELEIPRPSWIKDGRRRQGGVEKPHLRMLPRVLTSLGLLVFVATAATLGACGEQTSNPSKAGAPVQPAPATSAAATAPDAGAAAET